MRLSHALTAAFVATVPTAAQRPTNTSICDYYTTALLKDNNAKNQATLLTLVVNTVVIGNYTMPNVGIKVPGILAPGTYMGKDVKLMPYFDGTLASTNRGGSSGVSVNFLDGGGADPLKKNMPANSNTSRQYFLLTHLYQFFGSLLGCSMQGMPGYDAYTAASSMYQVHKFMDLDNAEVGYFITQVGLAAASFGVAEADVTAVGKALMDLFGYKCAPPMTAIKAQGPQLQSICIADDCPLAPNAVCDKYEKAVKPMTAANNSSSMSMSMSMPATGTNMPTTTGMGSATMTSGMASGTGSRTASPTSIATAGAAVNGLNAAAAACGLAAFLL